MKASETSILQFLQKPALYQIPIYQRRYSWTSKQCERLWNDVVDLTTRTEKVGGHFLGSIVYIEDSNSHVSSIPSLLLIDGQQRLTTISLLLCALSEHTSDNVLDAHRIRNYYLINREEDGDRRYKILLTDSDRVQYVSVIDSDTITDPDSQGLLVKNYKFFKQKLAESGLSPDEVLEAISRLEMIDVALDRRYDEPQVIFDSLNSTGLSLSESDRIRNYILMRLEPNHQNDLYERHWHVMEEDFGRKAYDEYFHLFVRDYLTLKSNRRIPKKGSVYEEFKLYAQLGEKKSSKELVEDLHRFSNYYMEIALGKEEADSDIGKALEGIRSLNVPVSYPFLLRLFDDYDSGVLEKADLLAILYTIESCTFRRSICGIPTNSLNKTFITLGNLIKKERYLESVQVAFATMDSYRLFPSNEMFTEAFKSRDIYNLSYCHYILRKLENYKRKEYTDVNAYTIEHIMPQDPNLPPIWRNILGEHWKNIHEKYLHTIGNLTLTDHNSELGASSFRDKRDMEGGYKNSPIRLNHSLSNLETWTEKQITTRAEELAKQAVKIWPSPEIEQSIIDCYLDPDKTYSIKGHTPGQINEYLTGDLGALFSDLRIRILNLHSSVKERCGRSGREYRIASDIPLLIDYVVKNEKVYRVVRPEDFVHVYPLKSRLVCRIIIPFDHIDDPKNMCRDVSQFIWGGAGEVQFCLENSSELNYVMFLINQSFVFLSEYLDALGQPGV